MEIVWPELAALKWPQDAAQIKALSVSEKQLWYTAQDPRQMIYLAQNPSFTKFWYWNYLLPLRLKRFVFKLKRACQGHL